MSNIIEAKRFLGTVFEFAEGSPSLLTEETENLIDFLTEESLSNNPWASTKTYDPDEIWGIPIVVTDSRAALLSEAGFPHSFEIISDNGKPTIKIWLFDKALTESVTLPAGLSLECPLPGVSGWRMAAPRSIKRYDPAAILKAFKPALKVDPVVPGSKTYNVLMSEPSKFQDALVFGELSREILEKEISFSFSKKGRNTSPGEWKTFTGKFGEALTNLFTSHVEGRKDGMSFLQGSAIAGVRRKTSMERMDLLVLDLDTGESIEAIKSRISESGLFALIYTTHSHNKSETEISRDAVMKYFSIKINPTVEQVTSYLQRVRSYQNEVVENLEIIENAKHTEDGIKIVVRHEPMQKFRVMFLLKDSFIFAERGSTHQGSMVEWEERYAGASKKIGAFFDTSCTDPSRLFYTPRHAPDSDYEIHIIAGEMLDIESLSRITKAEWKEEASVWEKAANAYGVQKIYKTDNLMPFLAKYGDRFEFEDFIRSVNPDGDRGPRPSGEGSSWRCPNDDNHSNAGDPDDKGFFCINASGTGNGFVARCMHNSCMEIDRAGHLDLICQDAGIQDAMELKKDFVMAVEDDEDQIQEEQQEEPETKVEPVKAFRNKKAAEEIIENVNKTTLKSDVSTIVQRLAQSKKINRLDLEELLKNLAKKSGTSFTVLKSEMKSYRQENKEEFTDELASALSKYNKTYGVILIGGKSRIIRNPIMENAAPTLMELDSFRLMHAPDKFPVVEDGNIKMQPMTKLWLEWKERNVYPNGIVFEPNHEISGAYNMWKGFPVKPRVGDWSLLKEHIFNNICSKNQEWYDWFITWMAQIIQEPGIKKGSAVVIKGKKGVGKSKVFEWLSKLMGPYAIKVSKKHHITGNFNAHQKGAILMVCEEAFWAGDTESGGVLKDLITSDSMMMEQKGFDPIMVSNYIRLAMISNEDWVAPASFEDERRFLVLECGDARRQDIEFFSAIDRQMENGGKEGFMKYLEDWVPPNKLGFDILRSPPKTEWLAGQAEESLSTLNKFLLLCVEEGCFPEVPGRIDDIQLEEEKENYINTNDLRECLSYHLRGTSDAKYKINNRKAFRSAMEEIMGMKDGLKKVGPRGSQKNHYIFPPLREIKRMLADKGIILEKITS